MAKVIPPLPDLDAEDMPDIFSLTADELAQVPADLKWWICGAANCQRRTKVKDFGVYPKIYWRKTWINLTKQAFFCSKHFQVYSRMIKENREHEFIYKPANEINILI